MRLVKKLLKDLWLPTRNFGGGYPCCCEETSSSSSSSPSHSSSSRFSNSSSTDYSTSFTVGCTSCIGGLAPGNWRVNINGLQKNTQYTNTGVLNPYSSYGNCCDGVSFSTLVEFGGISGPHCYWYGASGIDCGSNCDGTTPDGNIDLVQLKIGPILNEATGIVETALEVSLLTSASVASYASWINYYGVGTLLDCCNLGTSLAKSCDVYASLYTSFAQCNILRYFCGGFGLFYNPCDYSNATCSVTPIGCQIPNEPAP